MLVTCAFNPLVELSGLPLAKADMGVERELSASLGSGSYNMQDQNKERQRWDSDRQHVRCARPSVEGCYIS